MMYIIICMHGVHTRICFVIHNAVTRDKWLFSKQSDKYGFFSSFFTAAAEEGA